MIGIAHCDDILGDRLPVLVPDDLSERELQNLTYAGVDKARFIPVPRMSACHVTNAFTPSKSFIRDSTFGPRKHKVNYGFIMEPNDIKAFNSRIRASLDLSVTAKPAAARVLFISRKDASGRYTTNEDEVVEALSRFGTRIITPTQVPINEIAQAIVRADVVISAFGSAILHFAAASPGTTLIEFDHPADDQCGRAICRVLDCRHVYCTRVTGRARDFTDMSDHPVNVDELVALVERELARRDSHV